MGLVITRSRFAGAGLRPAGARGAGARGAGARGGRGVVSLTALFPKPKLGIIGGEIADVTT